MENLNKIKNIIENNPIAFTTVTNENKPNVIGVAFAKVISEDKILITDNYMNQTIKDITKNSSVCLIVWNSEMSGYKFIGNAIYFETGKWKDFVKKMKENEGLPAKGAVIVTVTKIISSK